MRGAHPNPLPIARREKGVLLDALWERGAATLLPQGEGGERSSPDEGLRRTKADVESSFS